ncbi:response regulator [Brevibacillus agri]|uniref:response regulator n=1 Tax=Brevibacillus agri TaxID=51101 RepID=UPI002367BB57|nr:response regulator [Brevibacillus agri]
MLARVGGLNIQGQNREPRMALDKIVQAPPQAVFLDIQMPERNGIELAERILQEHPDTAIIFVTAYDEYAIKAFELNALDYLLKPIQYDRLQKTIERLFKSRPPQPASVLQAGTGFLRCFRSLQMEQAGREPVTIRWKTVKGQEVFAFLLHHRGTVVKKQVLLDQLWPDIDWKKGITQLYTTVYPIRKTLNEEGLAIQIVNCDEGYLLEMNGTRLDVSEWEAALDGAPELTGETVDGHLRLSQQYRGDYLADHHYRWAETERSRLRGKFLQHAHRLARCRSTISIGILPRSACTFQKKSGRKQKSCFTRLPATCRTALKRVGCIRTGEASS